MALKADRIVALTPSICDELLGVGYPRDRIRVIPNGVRLVHGVAPAPDLASLALAESAVRGTPDRAEGHPAVPRCLGDRPRSTAGCDPPCGGTGRPRRSGRGACRRPGPRRLGPPSRPSNGHGWSHRCGRRRGPAVTQRGNVQRRPADPCLAGSRSSALASLASPRSSAIPRRPWPLVTSRHLLRHWLPASGTRPCWTTSPGVATRTSPGSSRSSAWRRAMRSSMTSSPDAMQVLPADRSHDFGWSRSRPGHGHDRGELLGNACPVRRLRADARALESKQMPWPSPLRGPPSSPG